MTHEELIDWLRESRARQGLPLYADDPVGLARVAHLILSSLKGVIDTTVTSSS